MKTYPTTCMDWNAVQFNQVWVEVRLSNRFILNATAQESSHYLRPVRKATVGSYLNAKPINEPQSGGTR